MIEAIRLSTAQASKEAAVEWHRTRRTFAGKQAWRISQMQCGTDTSQIVPVVWYESLQSQ